MPCKAMFRPFAANGHMVQTQPHWRTKECNIIQNHKQTRLLMKLSRTSGRFSFPFQAEIAYKMYLKKIGDCSVNSYHTRKKFPLPLSLLKFPIDHPLYQLTTMMLVLIT